MLCSVSISEQTTGNAIKVFRRFPRFQRKCRVDTQNPRCTVCFPCGLLQNQFQNVRPNAGVPASAKFRHNAAPKHTTQSKCSSSLCCTLPTINVPSPYLLHFPALKPLTSQSLLEGQAGTACELSEQYSFLQCEHYCYTL